MMRPTVDAPGAVTTVVGVVSDTHGRLPGAVLKAFAGVDVIIHAGDIENPADLDELARLAPVRAVRGNMDAGAWAHRLPLFRTVEAGGLVLAVVHDLERLPADALTQRPAAVISGHTHRPDHARTDGIVYLNPGSAVQPRFNYPPSVVRLTIARGHLAAHFLDLDVLTEAG